MKGIISDRIKFDSDPIRSPIRLGLDPDVLFGFIGSDWDRSLGSEYNRMQIRMF